MTREKEIDVAATHYDYGYNEDSIVSAYCCFRDGVKWADANPKSPWISVEEDLPCNHKNYINTSDECGTFYVLALIHDFVALSRMEKIEDEWHWITDEPTYWMPIPKLPK